MTQNFKATCHNCRHRTWGGNTAWQLMPSRGPAKASCNKWRAERNLRRMLRNFFLNKVKGTEACRKTRAAAKDGNPYEFTYTNTYIYTYTRARSPPPPSLSLSLSFTSFAEMCILRKLRIDCIHSTSEIRCGMIYF
jgi:hypothetical protein